MDLERRQRIGLSITDPADPEYNDQFIADPVTKKYMRYLGTDNLTEKEDGSTYMRRKQPDGSFRDVKVLSVREWAGRRGLSMLEDKPKRTFSEAGPPTDVRGFRPDPMAQRTRSAVAEHFLDVINYPYSRVPGVTPPAADVRRRLKKYGATDEEIAAVPEDTNAHGYIRRPEFGETQGDLVNLIMAGPIAVEKALASIPLRPLSAKVVKDRLLKAGASKGELEVRGIGSWLDEMGDRPVDPSELVHRLQQSPFELKETVRRDMPKIEWDKLHKLADAENKGQIPNTTEGRQAYIDLQKRAKLSPKFSQWQTPGGKNYREILLQAPGGTPAKVESQFDPRIGAYEDVRIPGTGFTGGHWDEPNVVAHIRVNDRTLPSGEKALHVDEWQSDWSLALREEMRGRKEQEKLGVEFLTPPSTPKHPLVDEWQDLAVRRTLKEAVDGGYDRLTWVTGQQTADRYDLSRQIQAVRYDPKRKLLEYLPKDATSDIDTEWEMFREMEIGATELPNFIGKEPARRLLSSSTTHGVHEIKGVDLKVGGEWADKLYDESMVNRLNKIGKRYGVKVEDVPLRKDMKPPPMEDTLEDVREVFGMPPNASISREQFQEYLDIGERSGDLTPEDVASSLEDYDLFTHRISGNTKVHSLKITPEMKKNIGSWKFHAFEDVP